MKRILLVRTDRVGDVVYITPMIRELRKTFPGAFIATLTRPHTENILKNNPHLNATITDNMEKGTFWNVVGKIRSFKFTDALLMMPTERAAYQLFWAGIKNRIGVGHKLYEIITGMKSVSRNNYLPLRHEVDYCMDLARKIGVTSENLMPEIFLSQSEIHESIDFLKNIGVQNENKKILIHTGSLGSAPNWSENKYFELIENLLSDLPDDGIKILLTAKEMSESFSNRAKKLNSKRVFDVSKSLDNLRDLIKIIARADIFLAPSTGPLHLADALNIKTVGLYCHRPMSCAKHHGVLNNRSINIEVNEESCRKYCSSDQNSCSIENSITVSEVVKAIIKLLNEN